MVHIFSTPETSQTVVGFGKFTLAKIPTSPSLPFSGTPKSLKEGSLAPDSRTMGESNGPSHRLFSILSLGHMMGWKIFYRQQESKGLNLFSDQSLHHLEETELSVPQSTACLCLASPNNDNKQHLWEAGCSPALWNLVKLHRYFQQF